MYCGLHSFGCVTTTLRAGNQDQLAVLQRVVKGEFVCPEKWVCGGTKVVVVNKISNEHLFPQFTYISLRLLSLDY